MKYAICFRGISYIKDYIYDNSPGMTPFTIDFSNCIEYNRKNIIDPLKNNGNEVDIFFNTYYSDKIQDYINEMDPVKTKLETFDPTIVRYNMNKIWQLAIDSLKLIREYQNEIGVKYDFIILTRFDILVYESIMNIFIPKDCMTVISPHDDVFMILDGSLLDSVIDIYERCVRPNRRFHLHTQYLMDHGIKCHNAFSASDMHCPFWKLARSIFVPDGHVLKEFSIDDIFDPSSKFYGFKYKPNSSFVSEPHELH